MHRGSGSDPTGPESFPLLRKRSFRAMGGLHLQRLAGVVRGELASDYGERRCVAFWGVWVVLFGWAWNHRLSGFGYVGMLTSVCELFSIFCSRRRPVSTAEFSFGSRMAALSQAFWTCTSVLSQIVRASYFICNRATPTTWSPDMCL